MDAFEAAANSDEEAAAYFARKRNTTDTGTDNSSKRADKDSKRTAKDSKRTDKTRKRLDHLVQPKATKAKPAAVAPKPAPKPAAATPATGVSKQQVQRCAMDWTLPQNLHVVQRLCLLQLDVDREIFQWKQELGAAQVALDLAVQRQAKATNELLNALMHKNILTNTD